MLRTGIISIILIGSFVEMIKANDDFWPNPFCLKKLPDVCNVEFFHQTKSHVFNESIVNPETIKKLYMEKGQLISLPTGIFTVFTEVEECRIPDCLVEHIPPNVFQNASNLNKLSLQQNRITTLERGTFKGAESLVEINLAINSIKDIEKSVFSNLPNLEILKLDDNKIEFLDENLFNNNKQLKSLNLDNNQLKSISFVSHLSGLVHLILTNNQISVINIEDFKELDNLKELILNGNKLISFDFHRFPVHSLTMLLLNQNNLTEIPIRDLKSNFPNLERFGFDGNNLTCDNVVDLTEYMNTNIYNYVVEKVETVDTINVNGIQCDNGTRRKIVPYTEDNLLKLGEWVKDDNSLLTNIILPVCVILVGLIVLIIVIVIRKRRTASEAESLSIMGSMPTITYVTTKNPVKLTDPNTKH